MIKSIKTTENKYMQNAAAGMEVMEKLMTSGYEAYFVGGFVRDRLMMAKGIYETAVLSPADIDIATDALPDEVKKAMDGMRVVDTGIRHGTVTVLAGGGKVPVEVTTYRTDSGYSDGRHPDCVGFTSSIEEDLKRRDFTINAMAMDMEGNIKDPFGGMEDLKKGVIRAVGDPDERFREDALRIMRALRFSSVLGFVIESETENAVMENRSMLRLISSERIWEEFCRLAAGGSAGDTVRRYVDVLGEVMPELLAMKGFDQHNEYHRYDVLEHCIRTMETVTVTEENRLYMKLAALFHDIGKPLTYSDDDSGRGHFYGHAKVSCQVTEIILARFRADKAIAGRISLLARYHDLIFEKDERMLKKWMNRLTPEILFEILEIKRADNMATGNMSRELMKKFDDIEKMMKGILKRGDCFSLKTMALDGNDIKRLGVMEGPEIGRILNELLEQVIEGRAPNKREPLLKIAENIIYRS